MILRIFLLLFPLILNAEAPSPCDAQLEKQKKIEAQQCKKRNPKSQKVWTSLQTAKESIISALTKSNPNVLIPYIGCDSTSLPKYEIYCASQETSLDGKHIHTFLKRISEQKTALNVVQWTNYGVNKDIYLLCSKSYKTKVLENFCKDKNFQPLIEIRKGPSGYYIFGVAIEDPDL